ncbi:MAG: rhomboid family intramembrane serine protease, partial [Planctomycetota bacterium]
MSELVEVYRTPHERALRERALVLASVGIPSLTLGERGDERLLVETHWAERAREELARYEEENVAFRRKRVLPPAAPFARAGVAAFALVLTLCFLAEIYALGGLDWLSAGRAHAAAIRGGELWRATTALVLHVDVPHLLSNLVFGLLFTYLLFHAYGGGLGLFALVLCGTLGNLTNAWIHRPEHLSIGASTAVFAAVGLLGSSEARARHLLAEPTTRRYLENLVARAYAEVHEVRRAPRRIDPGEWVMKTFPQAFRRHIRAFHLTLLVTLIGAAFGALVVATDTPAKRVILPFDHLMGSPSERVAKEESVTEDRMSGERSMFSAQLMQNNIRVSIMALALGMTFGFGTFLVLFYNGVILGAVVFDYMSAGETVFLLGWLLPHGSIELPAIFLAGQAGLVLAHALIGFGDHQVLSARLRSVGPDLVTLITGVSLMLVWAGIVEAFFSQY